MMKSVWMIDDLFLINYECSRVDPGFGKGEGDTEQ